MTDTLPPTEPQSLSPIAAVQKNLLSQAHLLIQNAPVHDSFPVSEQQNRLIAQQRVRTPSFERGVLNVHLAGDEKKVCTPTGIHLENSGDNITLGFINKGNSLFNVRVEQGRIQVIFFPDRGIDFKELGFPEPTGFPATISFDLANPHYSQTELAPLASLVKMIEGFSTPENQFDARLHELGIEQPPQGWPIDRSTSFISPRVQSIAVAGEKPEPRGKDVWSFPYPKESVTEAEHLWMDTFIKDMTPQHALEWLSHTAGTLTRRQLQLAREAIATKSSADKQKLFKMLEGSQVEEQKSVFVDYLTDAYAEDVLYFEEIDRNFKLKPTQENAQEMQSMMTSLLETRLALEELAHNEPGGALMNYILHQQGVSEQTAQHNTDAAIESASDPAEAFITQGRWTSDARADISMWKKAYMLYYPSQK